MYCATRIPVPLAYEVYIRSCKISIFNSGSYSSPYLKSTSLDHYLPDHSSVGCPAGLLHLFTAASVCLFQMQLHSLLCWSEHKNTQMSHNLIAIYHALPSSQLAIWTIEPFEGHLHSSKLTWKRRGAHYKTTILYKGLYMSFHVDLGEGSP